MCVTVETECNDALYILHMHMKLEEWIPSSCTIYKHSRCMKLDWSSATISLSQLTKTLQGFCCSF